MEPNQLQDFSNLEPIAGKNVLETFEIRLKLLYLEPETIIIFSFSELINCQCWYRYRYLNRVNLLTLFQGLEWWISRIRSRNRETLCESWKLKRQQKSRWAYVLTFLHFKFKERFPKVILIYSLFMYLNRYWWNV